MTKDEDLELEDLGVDTSMGLDLEFEGDYVVAYKTSISSIRQMDHRTYAQRKRIPTDPQGNYTTTQ